MLFIFTPAYAAEPIKIGEMMPYTGGPGYSYPFREGWQLALEEINAAGGINGRLLEVISRDDKGDPGEAIRVSEELVLRDDVDMLIGGGYDHVGLAVGTYANKNKIPYIKEWGGRCDLVADEKNEYWFFNMICIDLFGDVYPKGWLTSGLPDDVGDHPAKEFMEKFERRYNKKPDATALDGYQIMIFAAEALRKAGTTNAKDIVAALKGLEIDSPYGHVVMDSKTKQPQTGYWFGYTDNVDGVGRFVDPQWYGQAELFGKTEE